MLRSYADIPLMDNSVINSIEVQKVSNNGIDGHVIVIHKPDGSIDVYYDQCLVLPEDWVLHDPAFSSLPVSRTQEIDLSDTICEIGESNNHVEASFVDLDGHKIACYLQFRTTNEDGPLVIPPTRHKHPVHCRFFLINRFRLVDRRVAQVSIRIDNDEIAPRRLSRFLPKYRLSARTGSELLLGGLGAPDSQSLPVVPLDDFEVGGGTTSLSFRFIEVTHQTADTVGGVLEVMTPIGLAATGQWLWRHTGDKRELVITHLQQDWRPPGWSPTRHLLRFVRRYKRRGESWSYTFKASCIEGEWRTEISEWVT